MIVNPEVPETQVSTDLCRVYWGSHGCSLPRGHTGPHLCECYDPSLPIDPETGQHVDADDCLNVGGPPYYGPDTHVYGEDAR